MTKSPINIDWNKVMQCDDDPPPDLEVVVESELSQTETGVSTLTDQQIEDKIQRLRFELAPGGIAYKLKDGGEKLRASLKRYLEEKEKRKVARLNKDADESEKPTQSRNSCTSDAFTGFSPKLSTSQAHSQGPFASHFLCGLGYKPDNGTHDAVNAFGEELRCFGRGKSQRSTSNGLLTHRGRQGTKMSSRRLPFRCPSSILDKKDKDMHISHDSDHKGITSIHPKGDLSSCFSERRRASQIQRSPNLNKRKTQTVVLLDEEDFEPLQSVNQGDKSDEWIKKARIYYPSRDDPECVELCCSDIQCLAPQSYLSSPIINFYIRYLQRPLSATGRPRGDYHFFNTYFYKKLVEAVSCKKSEKDSSFMKFRRWWKGVNIFQKAYIFLPIHAEQHWSLVIICIPANEDDVGPIILHLDSLGYHTSKPIFKNVRSYLLDEWNFLNQEIAPPDHSLPERIWKNLDRRLEHREITVPQQKNEYDCGLFVLYFMERFIEEAPERVKRRDLDKLGRQWFQPEEASGLRKRIKNLLMEEFENARLEEGSSPSRTSSIDVPEETERQCSDS